MYTEVIEILDFGLTSYLDSYYRKFEKRPTRPKKELGKNPSRKDKVLKLIIENRFLKENINIDPRKRWPAYKFELLQHRR